MPELFIPTAGRNTTSLESTRIAKGQLYNLDNNQKLGFQFNPESFEWERNFNFAETSFIGDESGGDIMYLNTGPRTFELVLVYAADPGAPSIEYESNFIVSSNFLRMDFQAIRYTIEEWEKKIPGLGRPSRIRVIIGPNYFDGVIRSSKFRIGEFFPDLSAQQALVALRFREWNPRLSS